VLKSTFDSCVHSYTFVTEKKALKEDYFMHYWAKTRAASEEIFSLARVPAQVAVRPYRLNGSILFSTS
jgi:hypothetical protein